MSNNKSISGVRIAKILQKKRRQVKSNLKLNSLVEADAEIVLMIDKALKGRIPG